MNEPVVVKEILYGSRRFELCQALEVETEQQGGLYFYEYLPLRILGYGKTRAAALSEFMEDFAAVYDAFAHEPDSKLTGDAQAVKAELNRLVVAVSPRSQPGD